MSNNLEEATAGSRVVSDMLDNAVIRKLLGTEKFYIASRKLLTDIHRNAYLRKDGNWYVFCLEEGFYETLKEATNHLEHCRAQALKKDGQVKDCISN